MKLSYRHEGAMSSASDKATPLLSQEGWPKGPGWFQSETLRNSGLGTTPGAIASLSRCPPDSGGEYLRSSRIVMGAVLSMICALLLASCRQEMADTGRIQPMDSSEFFKDGRMARSQPLGTVARNQLRDNEQLYTGMQHSKLSPTFPFEITEPILKRGKERFNIYCAPCHDGAGTGHGIAVQRGFQHGPETFHQQRLRDAAPGYFYQAISNGFGMMNGYAAQISPNDRWAIVAYIRALQLSENAVAKDLPDLDRQKLESQN